MGNNIKIFFLSGFLLMLLTGLLFLKLDSIPSPGSSPQPPKPPAITPHPYKEPPVSGDIRNKYFPIWERVFMEKNKISQDYFDKHIEVENISKMEWKEGESLAIRYLVRVDWATARLRDSILIKPQGQNSYYTVEELQETLTGEGGTAWFHQVSTFVPIESVVGYESAILALRSKCHPLVEPGEVIVEQGVNRGVGELLLKAGGVINEKKNQCKSARLRLSDGILAHCSDSPCRID